MDRPNACPMHLTYKSRGRDQTTQNSTQKFRGRRVFAASVASGRQVVAAAARVGVTDRLEHLGRTCVDSAALVVAAFVGQDGREALQVAGLQDGHLNLLPEA